MTTRRRPSPIPGRKHLKLTPANLQEWQKLVETVGVSPGYEKQLENYFEDIERLVRSRRAKAEYGAHVLGDIRAAARSLKDALACRDPAMIAVRAISLGEYRYLPGAHKANSSAQQGRINLNRAHLSNPETAKQADERLLAEFSEWQVKLKKQLNRTSPPNAARRVAQFLQTGTRAQRSAKGSYVRDRDRRRIKRLLAEGRIPDLI